MSSMKGFKTIAFNMIMVVIAIGRAMSPEVELPDAGQVTAAVDAVEVAIGLIWGVGNAILRAVTDTPIFRKE